MDIHWLARILISLGLLGPACTAPSASNSREGTQDSGDPAHPQTRVLVEEPLPGLTSPPRGRWRLAPRDQLEHVVLWV